jgi:hypothetical protein
MDELKMDVIHHKKTFFNEIVPNELIFGKGLALKPRFLV